LHVYTHHNTSTTCTSTCIYARLRTIHTYVHTLARLHTSQHVYDMHTYVHIYTSTSDQYYTLLTCARLRTPRHVYDMHVYVHMYTPTNSTQLARIHTPKQHRYNPAAYRLPRTARNRGWCDRKIHEKETITFQGRSSFKDFLFELSGLETRYGFRVCDVRAPLTENVDQIFVHRLQNQRELL